MGFADGGRREEWVEGYMWMSGECSTSEGEMVLPSFTDLWVRG